MLIDTFCSANRVSFAGCIPKHLLQISNEMLEDLHSCSADHEPLNTVWQIVASPWIKNDKSTVDCTPSYLDPRRRPDRVHLNPFKVGRDPLTALQLSYLAKINFCHPWPERAVSFLQTREDKMIKNLSFNPLVGARNACPMTTGSTLEVRWNSVGLTTSVMIRFGLRHGQTNEDSP